MNLAVIYEGLISYDELSVPVLVVPLLAAPDVKVDVLGLLVVEVLAPPEVKVDVLAPPDVPLLAIDGLLVTLDVDPINPILADFATACENHPGVLFMLHVEVHPVVGPSGRALGP